MAEKLEAFDFHGPGAKRVHLCHDEWFDGSIWCLQPGIDFNCKPKVIRAALARAATRHGGKVRTSIEGNAVVMQFYRPDEA